MLIFVLTLQRYISDEGNQLNDLEIFDFIAIYVQVLVYGYAS